MGSTRAEAAEHRGPKAGISRRLSPLIPLAAYATLAGVIIAAGVFLFTDYSRRQADETVQTLQVMADLKAGQIIQWYDAYRKHGEELKESMALRRWLNDFARQPGDNAGRREVSEWMAALKRHYDYEDILLIDVNGEVLISSDVQRNWLGEAGWRHVAEAQAGGAVILSDLHRVAQLPGVHIDLYVPIAADDSSGSGATRVVAVLVLRISPYRRLYPLLQSCPIVSASAETYLVEASGDGPLVLSELRYVPGAALSFRYPPDSVLRSLFVAPAGETAHSGRDYRGEEVLAVARTVAGTPWTVIAQIDRAEVLDPVRLTGLLVLSMVLSLLVLTGVGLGVLWYRGTRRLASQMAATEAERHLFADRYFSLLKHARDIIFFIDAGGRILEANDAAVRAYGYSHEELKGLTNLDLRAPHTRDLAKAQLAEADRTGITFETEHRRKDGSTFPVEISAAGVGIGRERMLLCIIRDVTARKESERILDAGERNLRQIIDLLPHGIYAKDRTGRFLLANRQFAEMMGTTGEALREAADAIEAIARERAIPSSKHDMAVIETGQPKFIAEETWIDVEGASHILQTMKVPFVPASGVDRAMLSVSIDVTDITRLQEELGYAQKMDGVGRLAGGIAHDFNNLLQIIIGFNDILLKHLGATHPDRANALEIEKAARRAGHLTRQLLAYSRRQLLVSRVMDLNALVEHMSPMLAGVLGEHVVFNCRLDASLRLVRVDPDQIEQVLVSLVDNARDAMPAGGQCTIQTKPFEVGRADSRQMPEAKPGQYACLSVSDTGTGMSRESLEHLFEPFFTTKGPGKGTGLGLAMVYGIIKQHDGWVRIYSQEGMGTTVKVFLPIADPVALPEAAVPENMGAAYAGACKILVIEDEPVVRQLAARVLKEQGFEVFSARTGREAMAVFERHGGDMDLVFSDVVLPDAHGLDLVRRMRAKQPGIRLLLTSGYMDEQSRWPEIEEQRIRFLQKPYPVKELLAAVDLVLRH